MMRAPFGAVVFFQPMSSWSYIYSCDREPFRLDLHSFTSGWRSLVLLFIISFLFWEFPPLGLVICFECLEGCQNISLGHFPRTHPRLKLAVLNFPETYSSLLSQKTHFYLAKTILNFGQIPLSINEGIVRSWLCASWFGYWGPMIWVLRSWSQQRYALDHWIILRTICKGCSFTLDYSRPCPLSHVLTSNSSPANLANICNCSVWPATKLALTASRKCNWS